ncbi:response regulator transcription factor [Enterococcus alishanensis]|uniref:Response regulator transcription factor n=1 Tax=Enterococcus alishanensis TaxID=1303817 RepID=A0ABS6TCG5_9ENTE|nr:response regulator transcription factor [Enterococcus alishanensis]MBV7390572.1 response regulator transcription factor [Enterococcus alishanensis]
MIKVLIAEDQGVLSSALAMILNLEDDLEVVGTAKDGAEAMKLLSEFKPDILLTDIEMPEKTGLDIAEELTASPTKVIILTTFARDGYFERAVAAKVSAYLLKDTPSEELINHIRAAMEGKTFYEPSLITGYMNNQKNPLSQKEQEILNLIAKGATSKEIAAKLYLSDGTIRNYISEIISKLAAKNRIDAAEKAKENGWL